MFFWLASRIRVPAASFAIHSIPFLSAGSKRIVVKTAKSCQKPRQCRAGLQLFSQTTSTAFSTPYSILSHPTLYKLSLPLLDEDFNSTFAALEKGCWIEKEVGGRRNLANSVASTLWKKKNFSLLVQWMMWVGAMSSQQNIQRYIVWYTVAYFTILFPIPENNKMKSYLRYESNKATKYWFFFILRTILFWQKSYPFAFQIPSLKEFIFFNTKMLADILLMAQLHRFWISSSGTNCHVHSETKIHGHLSKLP